MQSPGDSAWQRLLQDITTPFDRVSSVPGMLLVLGTRRAELPPVAAARAETVK